ncbi:Cyclin-T1-5 [Zea mays]|uniref:Cyclin-T1-5 n=1 Tax=Zea mays TaxID=4577 RepID=A0A1D6JBT7_MAIZE|nr:Cyclin-T1-5 [Zea mays]
MDIMQTSDSSHHGIVENSPYRIPYDRHAEGGQLGASWYFSRKEIEENSLSRRDGIDLKKESYLRKSYCTFLQDLGMRLKVPQVTIATAIVFCHRFFLRQSHAKNDRRTIATVCMFLAGKVEETPRPLKDVILLSYEIIHKKDPAAVQRIKQKEVYEQQKELILLGERVVLVTLGFDLNVNHPYKPLVEAIKIFKVAQNALAQVAWNFVNDGLRTSLCLQFKPHHIAAGAIFLAAKFLKVKLPSDGEKVWWQEFDVTPWQLEGWSLDAKIPPNDARDGTANSNEGPNVSSSMMDAMKKVNKDKVKAALEKRRKSKGDFSRKVDVMDDDDLIERELEHGVELAAEDEKVKQERKQSWPHLAHHQSTNRENTEEGELSMDSQEYRSPEHDNRKRKDVRVLDAYLVCWGI